MKIRHVLLLFTVVLLLFTVGCSADKDEVSDVGNHNYAEEIQDDLELFSGGDISAITESVFGITSGEATADGSGSGIIADLFANADVQVATTDESSVTYTIVAPDLSDFFTVCAEEIDAVTTSEELGQVIMSYAEAAPRKEYTVSVPYTISDTGIDVAYDTPEFINAMTGGLLEAYSALYDQYLSEEG